MDYNRVLLEWFLGRLHPTEDFFALSVPRSSSWPKVRKEHLLAQPFCQACGTTKNLEVHHIIPFHVDRSKELDPNNLITLCDATLVARCHLLFGHLLSWSSINPNVVEDAKVWLNKIKNRS